MPYLPQRHGRKISQEYSYFTAILLITVWMGLTLQSCGTKDIGQAGSIPSGLTAPIACPDPNWSPSTETPSDNLTDAALSVSNVVEFGAKCNGIANDAVAIQAAVDAASPYTQIVLPRICGVGSAGIVLDGKSHLEITGFGIGGIKVLGVSTKSLSTFGATTLVIKGGMNVRVTGLSVDGNAFETNLIGMYQCVECEISSNRTTSGGLNAAIYALGGTRNKILFNTVQSTIGNARGYWIGSVNTIEVEDEPDVEGNRCYLASGTCFVLTANGGRVTNNLADGASGSGFAFSASGDSASNNMLVAGNASRNNRFHGFQSDASTAMDRTHAVALTGNFAELNAKSGFYVVRAMDWAVADNVGRDNGISGFQVEDSSGIVMTGNQSCDSRVGPNRTQQTGFIVNSQTSANGTQDISLIRNVASNHAQQGILITNAFPGTGSNFTVVGNTIINNSNRGLSIIPAVDTDLTHIVVSDNVALNNAVADIEVRASDVNLGPNQYGTLIVSPPRQASLIPIRHFVPSLSLSFLVLF